MRELEHKLNLIMRVLLSYVGLIHSFILIIMFRSLNISYLTFCPTGQVSSIKSSSIKYLISVGGLLKRMYCPNFQLYL